MQQLPKLDIQPGWRHWTYQLLYIHLNGFHWLVRFVSAKTWGWLCKFVSGEAIVPNSVRPKWLSCTTMLVSFQYVSFPKVCANYLELWVWFMILVLWAMPVFVDIHKCRMQVPGTFSYQRERERCNSTSPPLQWRHLFVGHSHILPCISSYNYVI